jgi:hypothetical protein
VYRGVVMKFSRNDLLKEIVNETETWPFAIACWEGGAAANNKLDSYSDIDLIVCVEDKNVEESFLNIKNRLQSLAEIEHPWRVPEPTWNGFSQCYYKLKESPDYFFIDLVIIKKSSFKPFESERHGNPVVHYDRAKILTITSADTSEFWHKIKLRLENLSNSLPFYNAIVIKELKRNHPLDALAFYRQIVAAYVELLGMKYRPFKHDFGLRYSHVDFPKPVVIEIEKFSFVSSADEIKQYAPMIIEKSETVISEVRDGLQNRETSSLLI